ncbi:MAG: protein-L-isoaspartate O-methyltransferase [Parvularculaceae bacterium]|jgi:protein-L-isoaspartate(D-aspartate) O-methyltransferase|nr:protein-L-isoaspartate O-methyltransferase [Parvularculaceae bacterium]
MDFVQARKNMVASQVRTNDVTDLRLQAALENAPREQFLPVDLKHLAYVEREIEYAKDRRLLTPRDFAKLLAAADVRPGDLVLDVACGSGYSTAVLAQLAEMVVGLEPDEALAQTAQANLNALGLTNAAVIVGDPAAGAAKQGPFDLIFLGAPIEVEPVRLLEQLKEGGRLASIIRLGGVFRGAVYRRSGSAIAPVPSFDASARHVLPAFAAPKVFKF